MNGPLISDIVREVEPADFPWPAMIIIGSVILILGSIVVVALYRSTARKARAQSRPFTDEEMFTIGVAIVFTFMFIAGAVASLSLGRGNKDGVEVTGSAEVAALLSEEYGVTIMKNPSLFRDNSDFRSLPREPAQSAHFDVLVGDTILPCVIATSSDRYSIACEDGTDARVLEPQETP